MAGKRFRAEQIIMTAAVMAEVGLAQGHEGGTSGVEADGGERADLLPVVRKEYGGLRLDQAKRLKVLEKENHLG